MLFEHLGNKKYFWQKFYDLYEEININKETPYMPKLLSFA